MTGSRAVTDRRRRSSGKSGHADLDRLVRPVTRTVDWDDLILPPAEIQLLHEIADQVRNRLTVLDDWGFRTRRQSLGTSVLFFGPSGTGKTLAAEVLARHLGLLLHRIELSQVISPYIAETEKNLSKLFDAASDGRALLFLDEADALFGKRSEVKDSHDRYANMEVGTLLQSIDHFEGLAIFTTSRKAALDPAFMRRLRFVVNFPTPDPAARLDIWKRAFPPQVPLGMMDYPRLARIELTGGSIHNIALNAAFLGAQSATPVSMAQVLAAARQEFRKLDKPINEADFR